MGGRGRSSSLIRQADLLRQIRVGKGLRPFSIYKFRTMVKDAPDKGAPITIGEDAPRDKSRKSVAKYKAG